MRYHKNSFIHVLAASLNFGLCCPLMALPSLLSKLYAIKNN